MKTYFVCSDIHGFYKEWMNSLKQSGFDKNNPEHILIILGDIFDRGEEPWKVYKYIKSLPEDRVVMVMGNHEYLLLELVNRKRPNEYDFHNGTYKTLICLSKDPYKVQDEWIYKNIDKYDENELYEKSLDVYDKAKRKLYDNKKLNEIVEWIKSPRWRHYYELGKYIFVHSFIPLELYDGFSITTLTRYKSDWRENSTLSMWYCSTWGCPYKLYLSGYFDEELKNGKILVCGHWHTSDFYNNLLYKDEPSKQLDIYKENPIFKSDKYPGLIAIDACTALTKTVNILVIKEEEIIKYED